MMTTKEVERQLKKVGCNYALWGSNELAQLPNLLMEGEEIFLAVNGYYEGGFGLLVVTNLRVLIVDKKPFVLNLEDLRYDMITEVNYGARFVLAAIHISLPTRTIFFESWTMRKLQRAMRYIQRHVLDTRNGGSPLPQDWFSPAATIPISPAQAQYLHPLVNLARSAMKGHDDEEEEFIGLGQRSGARGVNPYAGQFPSLARRRRYPVFYNV